MGFLLEIRRLENRSSHNKGSFVHVMNNRTVLVRYSTGKEHLVSACDLSAPERNSIDTYTSDYHQSIPEDLTRSRVSDPPEEPSMRQRPTAETPLLPDAASERTLTETPVESHREKSCMDLLRPRLSWNR